MIPKDKLFNDFFYLCRELRYIIRISQNSITKLKYDNLIKIRKDSGVGYLSDGRIIVGGGTDSSGCLSSKVYLLDPVNSKVTVLPDLPVSAKEGNFFHYKEFVYYVGAIKDTDDEEILAQEQSAPIMKYYLSTGTWEVFHEENEKLNFQDYLKLNAQKMNETIEEDENDLTYKEILYPGMFMIGSKVYLINGQKMTSRGILKTISNVFSLDLEEDGFEFKIENFKSPFDVFRPLCGSYLKTAFVTGGLLHSSKSCNFESYLIDFSRNEPEFRLVAGLKVDIDDTYPVIGNNKSFIALAFPNLAIFDYEQNTWSQFQIDPVSVLRRESKNPTPMMETLAGQVGKTIKTRTNLVAAGDKVKIINDDVPSGESLSQPDLSFNVKLPPGLLIDPKALAADQEDLSPRSSRSSSRSSNTFSVEKRIPLPEAVKDKLASSRSSSLSSKGAIKVTLKNRPIAGQLKVSNKANKWTPDQSSNGRSSNHPSLVIENSRVLSKSSVDSSQYFEGRPVPRFSDSDSVFSEVREPKLKGPDGQAIQNASNRPKSSNKRSGSSGSNSSSSSSQSSQIFKAESSFESIPSSKSSIKAKPLGQRLAPIKLGQLRPEAKVEKFSFSDESQSESFAYEEEIVLKPPSSISSSSS